MDVESTRHGVELDRHRLHPCFLKPLDVESTRHGNDLDRYRLHPAFFNPWMWNQHDTVMAWIGTDSIPAFFNPWIYNQHGMVIGLQFFCLVFTVTLINKPILKSIRPKLFILSQLILQKITKMAITQNPILPKCHLSKAYSSYIFR